MNTIDVLEQQKQILLKQANAMQKAFNQDFPPIDISKPMRYKEKERRQEIANVWSEINQIAMLKRIQSI